MRKVLSKIDNGLAVLGRWSSRGSLRFHGAQYFAFALPCLVICAALGLLIAPQYWKEYRNIQPTFDALWKRPASPPESWRVIYDNPSSATGSTCSNDVKCPGNLENESSWKGAAARGDWHKHFEIVSRMRGHSYWVGLQIPPDILARAQALHLKHFFLGELYGTYQIWWHGRVVSEGSLATQRNPVVIDFSEADFKPSHGDTLSIHIQLDANAPYPDDITWARFVSETEMQNYGQILDFSVKETNSISFGFNLAMAIFFLALWLCNIQKQELAIIAAYAILYGLVQSAMTPLVSSGMGTRSESLRFVTSVYEPLLLMFVGLSIARLRSLPVLLLQIALLLAPLAVFFLDLPALQLRSYAGFASSILSPLCYLVAASICLVQERLLTRDNIQDLRDPGRIQKLRIATAVLTLMCLTHAAGVYFGFDLRHLASVCLLGLAVGVVHDYRRHELFIRHSPFSKYHQRAKLPVSVSCVMISLDLKNSEGLFRFGSEAGVGSTIVQEIITALYDSVSLSGGEVIQSEGDSLIFFFDLDEIPDALPAAVRTVTKLNALLADCLGKISLKWPAAPTGILHLRTAAVSGQVKPVWLRFAGRISPSWSQIGAKNIFVDLARLMEAEKSIAEKTESTLIVDESLALKLDQSMETLAWKVRSATVEAKHGRKLQVSALRLPDVAVLRAKSA